MLSRSSGLIFASIIGAVMFSAAGCGSDTTKNYIPTTTVARDALSAALTTWQSGTAHGTIETHKPAINVFDLRWQSGQKLETFEIVEELAGRDHPTFTVKIKLDKVPEEIDTFLVVGIDPLLVFRDTDYLKATGQ
jgi:hypothetical protein